MEPVHWLLAGIHAAAGVLGAGHALLHKRDPRSALGWAAVCLTFPLAGPLLYFLFGFNRVRTRAKRLSFPEGMKAGAASVPPARPELAVSDEEGFPVLWRDIMRVTESLTGSRLLRGNRVEMLQNGEEAYPSMLDAIAKAERSVFLSTYIFETNRTGRHFIEHLAAAATRGVDTRVIVDGIGGCYSFPRATSLLKKARVRTARYLPPGLFPPSLSINLRNHRKILAVDGQSAFLGGMNIGDRHLARDSGNPARVIDTHFHVEGPVVKRIEQVFLHDWAFCTGEEVERRGDTPSPAGDASCQVILTGPDEDLDKIEMLLVAAVSSAKERVWIMTPYFLPPRDLIRALQAAALKGVDVRVILPAKNNLPFVHWATRNMLWELLRRNVRVHYQPPPFVHSKLFVVDDYYAQVGSANLDPRSLRLNFELALEIYSRETVAQIAGHMARCLEASAETRFADLERRSTFVRLRDALAWVMSPYL